MNPRLATMATWCRELAVPVLVLASLAAFGSAGSGKTGTAPIVSRLAPALTADVNSADKRQPIAVDKTDVVAAGPPVTQALAEPTAAREPEPQPKPIVTAALTDTSETLPSEPSPAEVASVSPADVQPADAKPADAKPVDTKPADTTLADTKPSIGSTEILDECFVVDACVDRYLWALYQRTPKEDTVKENTQREVTVKRKGKMVTVTRTVSQVVDEDFAWKDPKAAEHMGMSMTDYVIDGMDRNFKLRLFHLLYAAEQAGLSPGITSAFRDDYRQSIASGLKAANDRSYHGGSFRGGYGHGLAADIVSIKGATRDERHASSETIWNWVDKHGQEFGIGRPYRDHDPPHVGPIDGSEYVSRRGARSARQAAAKPRHAAVARAHADQSAAKRVRTANAVR
jgi:hypothetical protein